MFPNGKHKSLRYDNPAVALYMRRKSDDFGSKLVELYLLSQLTLKAFVDQSDGFLDAVQRDKATKTWALAGT